MHVVMPSIIFAIVFDEENDFAFFLKMVGDKGMLVICTFEFVDQGLSKKKAYVLSLLLYRVLSLNKSKS